MCLKNGTAQQNAAHGSVFFIAYSKRQGESGDTQHAVCGMHSLYISITDGVGGTAVPD